MNDEQLMAKRERNRIYMREKRARGHYGEIEIGDEVHNLLKGMQNEQ